ncbi:SDR family NAD(P)-dependent oxidoreductase [Enterococcus pallens]|uniref:Uncharacterized protein n=1 Tax=Enterococcus pallens ATCC BAA-351 TaxID=1158607 RepID=R2TBA1_9ENTE|nr:SDR family NAD(P)-dependent oxidoreductase [Enterococcus pallens]EOH97459.1 hypothetical protein UAU_00127 [Enterococcus pallens ATCC BAA-351]EOU21122.1 hypothetical protein I588_01969 [Enterococcus pallens ATCC BAA-351]OJG80673.1 hypothetical protein RV10_GL004410 [Enterococcus pallens]
MFEQQVVLINGACGGIGRVCAQKFYEAGAKLILTDISLPALEEMKEANAYSDERCICQAADITKESEVIQVVNRGVEHFNKLNHLVNCGGIDGKQAYITDMEEYDFDVMMNTNVKGTFFFIKHAIKEMLKDKQGTIVNISSIAGLSASRRKPLYSAAKHAVNGLTKSVALEYVNEGIRVNSICPGSVDTAMIRAMEEKAQPENPAAAHADFVSGIPLKRYAKPDEIADLVLFLSSNKSSYIVGCCCRIDGGIAAK